MTTWKKIVKWHNSIIDPCVLTRKKSRVNIDPCARLESAKKDYVQNLVKSLRTIFTYPFVQNHTSDKEFKNLRWKKMDLKLSELKMQWRNWNVAYALNYFTDHIASAHVHIFSAIPV